MSLGESLTDGDGRLSVSLNESMPSMPSGTYPLRFQVKGDASLAESTLRVSPKGTHLVVFDIDGTLTTTDEEIMKDFEAELLGPLSKGYTPRPGALTPGYRIAARTAAAIARCPQIQSTRSRRSPTGNP